MKEAAESLRIKSGEMALRFLEVAEQRLCNNDIAIAASYRESANIATRLCGNLQDRPGTPVTTLRALELLDGLRSELQADRSTAGV